MAIRAPYEFITSDPELKSDLGTEMTFGSCTVVIQADRLNVYLPAVVMFKWRRRR